MPLPDFVSRQISARRREAASSVCTLWFGGGLLASTGVGLTDWSHTIRPGRPATATPRTLSIFLVRPRGASRRPLRFQPPSAACASLSRRSTGAPRVLVQTGQPPLSTTICHARIAGHFTAGAASRTGSSAVSTLIASASCGSWRRIRCSGVMTTRTSGSTPSFSRFRFRSMLK